jgi:cell division septum initiation protein DivIVA
MPMSGEEARSSATGLVLQRVVLITSEQLRTGTPRRSRFGGYDREEVDRLRERAAKTIDTLVEAVENLKRRFADREHDETPDEAVSGMLATAARVLETVTTEARAEAERMLAAAADEREHAAQLREEAEAEIDRARSEAAAIVAAAEAERERLLAQVAVDAARAREELDAERQRLDAAIDDLRAVWTDRIGRALSRLDGLAAETADTSPEGRHAARSTDDDLVAELGGRATATAAPPDPARSPSD